MKEPRVNESSRGNFQFAFAFALFTLFWSGAANYDDQHLYLFRLAIKT